MTAQPARRVDVLVAGAGVVGLATALAIRRGTALPMQILVSDPALAAAPRPRTFRAVAIAADARRLLDALGVWDAVAPTAQPITGMELTDTRVGAVPPPVYLRFDDEAGRDEPFAHMVLHDELHAALLAACRDSGILTEAQGVYDLAVTPPAVMLRSAAGPVAARLLVAADGSRSPLREAAGIRTVGWAYDQSAITVTLAHDEAHGGRAIQHFLPGGPLALLPLRAADGTGRRTSIVWTERHAEAGRLAALPEAAFVAALETRIGHGLGTIRLEDAPRVIPLRVEVARGLVGPRMALAGDAARTIHPLAGQGLNLGLRDAAVLGRLVAGALDLGLDPGAGRVLAAYERERRPAAAAMAAMTDGLNRLFSNDHAAVRATRDLGLGLVDRAPRLKRRLMREAAGAAADEVGPA